MKTMKQLREEIAEKTKLGHRAYEEAGPDLDFLAVKCLGEGDTKSKVEKLQALNRELGDLKTDYDELVAIESARRQTGDLNDQFNKVGSMVLPGKGTGQPERKSIGELIMKSAAARSKGVPAFLDVDLKADFFIGTPGWVPESMRLPRVELYPTRVLQVADYLPVIPTTQTSIKYMLETVYTATLVVEKAEGAALGEATLTLAEQTQVVEKLGTFIPVSEEQLEDVPAAEAYLNNRLGYMVRARLDSQILNGDGLTPNLKGTLNIGGSLQTQAKGADPTPDAIYKLFTKLRTVGFAEPSVVFINPTNWQDVRLLRTADGIYIFGNPNDPGADRVWGIPVVQTTAVVVNTAIAGDYANFATLYLRRGLEVEMSSGYSDYFIKGKFAVKATMRCAVVHFRTSAFGTVTGI